jgi:hypothetical protein
MIIFGQAMLLEVGVAIILHHLPLHHRREILWSVIIGGLYFTYQYLRLKHIHAAK